MRWLVLVVLALPASAFARTLVHAGTLIDGVSKKARQEVTVVVDGERIVEVVRGYATPGDGDTVVDLRAHTVLPGLIDCHVHLDGELSPASYSEGFFLHEADFALRAAMYAERTLMAGFTTVRDLGDDGVVVPALRDAIARGWVPGPRIFAAGKSLTTTGGHGDPSNGIVGEYATDPGPAEGVLNGPEEAREAVRHRYKHGSDWIKLTATGGVLSLAASGDAPLFSEDELSAVVTTAHDYGIPVAAHAHGAEGMRRAVLAGVDSIEHGTYMTDEVMALMKERGTFLVPTLLAGRFVTERASGDFFPEVVRPKAAAIGPLLQATFARAYAAGVPIAFGTDTGVSPHGENAGEFALMVEGGMTPMEAIQAATVQAARLLRAEDLGSVEAGKMADMVAVHGDPLADITLLTNVTFVMQSGRVIEQP